MLDSLYVLIPRSKISYARKLAAAIFLFITKPTTRSSSPSSIFVLPDNINETGKSEWRHTI